MSSSTPLATGRHIASFLWFPFLFAIALPLIFELPFTRRNHIRSQSRLSGVRVR